MEMSTKHVALTMTVIQALGDLFLYVQLKHLKHPLSCKGLF